MSMRVKIENVTASVRVRSGLDPSALANAERDGSDGSAKATVYQSDSITVQVYSSGNVVSTGARSTKEAKEAICKTLSGLGVTVDPAEVEIKDIMASSYADHDVDLGKAYLAFGESAEYDPEWFTGVIVHMDPKGCTGVVYASGKIVVSGCRDMDAVYGCLEQMMAVLSEDRASEGS